MNDIIIYRNKNDKVFIVKADGFALKSIADGPTYEALEVTVNGVVTTKFGETFAGHELNADDLLYHAIAFYLSNNSEGTFYYVHPDIAAIMNDESRITLGKCNGRTVYETIYNDELKPLSAQIWWSVIEDDKRNEYVGYVGEDDESCALVSAADGSVCTTYDNFYIGALVSDSEKESFAVICYDAADKEALEQWDINLSANGGQDAE